jgi:hypothetical protein
VGDAVERWRNEEVRLGVPIRAKASHPTGDDSEASSDGATVSSRMGLVAALAGLLQRSSKLYGPRWTLLGLVCLREGFTGQLDPTGAGVPCAASSRLPAPPGLELIPSLMVAVLLAPFRTIVTFVVQASWKLLR